MKNATIFAAALAALTCAAAPIDRMLAATDARHFVDMGVPIAIIGAEGGGAHALGEWISLPCLDEYADLLEKFILDAPRRKLPTARELGERYQRTRAEEDRLAWVTALDAEGWDFKQRTRSSIDARGVYKFNRESKVLCVVLRKTDRPGDSWDEDVTPDGRIHFEWTRKPNGGIDYHYSAPTSWDVFVNAYPGMVTRYGAKVMKARIGKGNPMPEVSLPEGWRIVAGEEFSGVNVREAFFTFERDGTNLPPPKVSVNWGTVAIASVHGAKDVSVDGATARFTPTARKPPATRSPPTTATAASRSA